MKNLITICGRGGSKGIPNKNIKALKNKPLIWYTINVAKQFQKIYKNTDIVLSTDSEDIREVAKSCGLCSDYQRPEKLATDSTGKIDVIRDVVLFSEQKQKQKYDYIIDLDITSPLRNLEDLKNAYNLILSDDSAVNLFSVSKASRNPYFNMVEQQKNGYYAQVKKSSELLLTRQSSPIIYELNASFYFYKRCFFDLGYKGAITDRSMIYEMPHICFDLDHIIDFEIMSFLIENNKLDFIL